MSRMVHAVVEHQPAGAAPCGQALDRSTDTPVCGLNPGIRNMFPGIFVAANPRFRWRMSSICASLRRTCVACVVMVGCHSLKLVPVASVLMANNATAPDGCSLAQTSTAGAPLLLRVCSSPEKTLGSFILGKKHSSLITSLARFKHDNARN